MDNDLLILLLQKIDFKIRLYFLDKTEYSRNMLLLFLEEILETCDFLTKRFNLKLDNEKKMFQEIQDNINAKDIGTVLDFIEQKKKEIEKLDI